MLKIAPHRIVAHAVWIDCPECSSPESIVWVGFSGRREQWRRTFSLSLNSKVRNSVGCGATRVMLFFVRKRDVQKGFPKTFYGTIWRNRDGEIAGGCGAVFITQHKVKLYR